MSMPFQSIKGYFCVANARRVSVNKASGATAYYWLYATTIRCNDNSTPAAELRVYARQSDFSLSDNTIVEAIAQVHFPNDQGLILLECSEVIPVPGQPSDPGYDDRVPNSYPTLYVLGNVVDNEPALGDPDLRGCTLAVSDYVRDGFKESLVQCVWSMSSRRWQRTPVPRNNSVTYSYGVPIGWGSAGGFRISTLSLSINVGNRIASGSNTSQVPSTTGAFATDGSPNKKRKFTAVASSSFNSPTSATQSYSQSSTSAPFPTRVFGAPASPVPNKNEAEAESHADGNISDHAPSSPLSDVPSVTAVPVANLQTPQSSPVQLTPTPIPVPAMDPATYEAFLRWQKTNPVGGTTGTGMDGGCPTTSARGRGSSSRGRKRGKKTQA